MKHTISILTATITKHQSEIDKLNNLDIKRGTMFIDDEISNHKKLIEEIILAIHIISKHER
jgi:hypothetical protein